MITYNEVKHELKFLFFCFLFFLLGLHSSHIEVPRPGLKTEVQLPAYTTAIATQSPSCACHLHYSSRQCQIPDALNEARDQTRILIDTSRIHFRCAATGPPELKFDCNPFVSLNILKIRPINFFFYFNWYIHVCLLPSWAGLVTAGFPPCSWLVPRQM